MKQDFPLAKLITIQEYQHKLDKLKKERMKIGKEIRSISQKLPELIRGLPLK